MVSILSYKAIPALAPSAPRNSMGIEMEIREIKTKADQKRFLRFVYDLYRDDPGYNDMNLTFVRNFLYRRDSFAKRHEVLPVLVLDHDVIKAECIFVIDETDEIKLSFLEFVPNAKPYLLGLREYSQKLMRRYQKGKVIIGINGQISYGLGILTDGYDREFEFNSNYNREYYTKELDEVFPVMRRAFSYKYSAKHSLSLLDRELLQKVESEIKFRLLDTRHFARDMMIMGKLCHASLKNTPYYSIKKPREMYELMRQMRFLMKKEDVIFAMKDGREIGFIFTHPDYAELFDHPRLDYVRFYLRYLKHKPKKVIYNVIGVLPEYQAFGIAVALIYRSIKLRKKNYPYGVSSFILQDNIPSTKLCRKLSTGIHKEFHLYEIRSEADV